MVHSEARTKRDNLTKIQSSNACGNVACSVLPRKGDGDAENWNKRLSLKKSCWCKWWYPKSSFDSPIYMGENRCLTYLSHSFKSAHVKTNSMTSAPSEDSDEPGQSGHWAHNKDWSDWPDAQADLSLRWAHFFFVFGFVVLWLIYYILVCLTCANNTNFCYFPKLPKTAMVFMYPCTCMLVFAYYIIQQTSSTTHLCLSRRPMNRHPSVHIVF